MGKLLIIKGADFSQNAVSFISVELDFANLQVESIAIAYHDNAIYYATSSGTPPMPSFYLIDMSNYQGYTKLKLQTNLSEVSRVLFTTVILEAAEEQKSVTDYDIPSSIDNCYYNSITANSEVEIDIPEGTQYIYLRKTNTVMDTTPVYAILKK